MNNMFEWFNHHLGGPIGSIIGAVTIFVIGMIVAMIIAAVVRGGLSRLSVNQRMNTSTGQQYDVEGIAGKIVFWFILFITVSAALNQLNLDSVSVPFANMVSQVLSFLPTLLGAAIVGIVGWVLATVARRAISTTLEKTSIDEKLSAEAGIQPISNTVADIIYWFILLIVITMVLGKLGLDGLFTPLTAMLNKSITFLPNIFMAGFVFFVGYIVAKIVRGIVTNLVSTLNLQGIADKLGMSADGGNNLPKIAGSLVFLLIIIPISIVALETLKIEVISRPATNMLNNILQAIPQIITAAAVLAITYFVVRMVVNIVKGLLENTAINTLPEKIGVQQTLGNTKVSDLVGHLIMFFAMLFATIAAAEILGFEQISEIITMFIEFGGNIILGAIIMVIGFWLANFMAGIVERSEQGSQFLANLVRVLIMGLVLAMGLKAMGIADSIVNLAFGLTLGSVAVAFALSFGLGGQEAAARFLRKVQDDLDAKADKQAENKQVDSLDNQE